MRATRGLLASLGAGLSLAAAASATLLIVSTVVAFRGWPGGIGRVADSTSSIAQPQREQRVARARVAPLALPVAAPHGSGAPAAGTRGSAGGQSPAAPLTVAGVEQTSPQGAPAAAGSVTSAATPGSAPSTAAGRTTQAVGGTVKRAGSGLAETVTNTTKRVGTAVEPLAPVVGDTVTKAGDAVGGTVKKSTDAVGGLVGKLAP